MPSPLPFGSLFCHLDLLYPVPFLLTPTHPTPSRTFFQSPLLNPHSPHHKATGILLCVWEGSRGKSRAALPSQGYLQFNIEPYRTPPESPWDCKEIQPVHPKGNQSGIFIGRTDAEAETPILWPPDVKNRLI